MEVAKSFHGEGFDFPTINEVVKDTIQYYTFSYFYKPEGIPRSEVLHSVCLGVHKLLHHDHHQEEHLHRGGGQLPQEEPLPIRDDLCSRSRSR